MSNIYQKKRRLTYGIAYSLIIIIAIVGLLINIKILPLNDAIRKAKKEWSDIHEINNTLEHRIVSQTTLAIIEEKAKINPDLIKTSKIIYIQEKSKNVEKN